MAEEWDGILISPYIHERRMNMKAPWYYSWDIASGCVWRKRAITKIEAYHDSQVEA